MRASMDELSFDQECGGKFVSSGGKAVPKFDSKIHVREEMCRYEPRLPTDWTLDFGTAPAASLVCQTYKGHVWVMDEIVLKDSSTNVAADEFLKRVESRSRGYGLTRLRIFGDAAGSSPHSNVGTSDYEILEKALARVRGIEWHQPAANPPIKDTLNAVRGRVATADRVVHLHIHPRCKELIKDLKTASWPDGSNKLKTHHCLAALRYYCHAEFEDAAQVNSGALGLPNLGGTTRQTGRSI